MLGLLDGSHPVGSFFAVFLLVLPDVFAGSVFAGSVLGFPLVGEGLAGLFLAGLLLVCLLVVVAFNSLLSFLLHTVWVLFLTFLGSVLVCRLSLMLLLSISAALVGVCVGCSLCVLTF